MRAAVSAGAPARSARRCSAATCDLARAIDEPAQIEARLRVDDGTADEGLGAAVGVVVLVGGEEGGQPRLGQRRGPALVERIAVLAAVARLAGVFLQDHLTAWERLHLLGGVRLVGLQVDHQFATENSIGLATRYQKDYLELAPRLGAVVDLGAGISTFAAFSEGLRGVLNYTGKEAPEPERSTMTEAGFKFANDDLHLSGSLAAYQLIRENVPTANPFIPGSTVQIGEQQSKGIELDLTWQPSPAFSLLAAYAYTDAQVTEDIINEVPTDGQDIDRIGKR